MRSAQPRAAMIRSPRATDGLRRAARRAVLRHRRWLAAMLAAAAVLLTVGAIRAPAPIGEPVLTAAADLPAGAALRPSDGRVQRVPAEIVPPGAVTDPAQLANRVLTGPLGAGEILTTSRLLTASQLTPEPGRRAAPVRIADPGAVALLRPGDIIDVLGTSGGGLGVSAAAVVAAKVRVLTVPRRGPEGGGGGLLNGSPATATESTPQGSLIVLDVREDTALALARAAAAGRLSVVLRAPQD